MARNALRVRSGSRIAPRPINCACHWPVTVSYTHRDVYKRQALGLSRQDAYLMAAQTLLGSAKLALESSKHPGELKDMVCSPAGTTIQAVRVLEEKGLRSAVMEACLLYTSRCV